MYCNLFLNKNYKCNSDKLFKYKVVVTFDLLDTYTSINPGNVVIQ